MRHQPFGLIPLTGWFEKRSVCFRDSIVAASVCAANPSRNQ